MEIENIDIYSLPLLPIPERTKLPKIRGIYFVISDVNNIEYIGKTNNLNERWKSHACCAELDNPKKCKIAWLEVSNKKDLSVIEKKFLAHYKPLINKKLPTDKSSKIKINKTKKVKPIFQEKNELRRFRDKLEITQEQLAKLIGVTSNTIARWERGERKTPNYLPLILKQLKSKD